MKTNKFFHHYLLLILLFGVLSLWILLTPPVVAQQQNQNVFLVDIPGVGWIGEARESDWGNLLAPNKITIYVRHQGPGADKWTEPSEPDAIVVTLPDKWDRRTANQLLLPVIKWAFSQERDIHFAIDKNLTRLGYVSPSQRQEDEWAGDVCDYIAEYRNAKFSGILAEHSEATVTNAYIENFGAFVLIVVASPRGDKALEFIEKTPNLPSTYIITGLFDLPSLRWTQRLTELVRENPNVTILQLQDLADPLTTHGRLDDTGYEGTWKVITLQGQKLVRGTLKDLLPTPPRKESSAPRPEQKSKTRTPAPDPGGLMRCPPFCPPPFPTPLGGGVVVTSPSGPSPSRTPPNGDKGGGATTTTSYFVTSPFLTSNKGALPPDLSGIDFSSLQLNYLTEFWDGETKGLGYVFRATKAEKGATSVVLEQTAKDSFNAFFVWLTLPPHTFWVNLNPGEPDRIIDSEMARTDAGRVMLEADFQMKKTVAKLIHPDSGIGKAFWDQLYSYIEKQEQTRLCFSFRQWIVPGNVTVSATADSFYIVDATLDVKLEADYLQLKGEVPTAVACPPDIDPALQTYATDLFRKVILPELIKQVNTAPEYRDIRNIFYSRVVAEWYKTQHRTNAWAFANIIDRGKATEWYSMRPWNPQILFNDYVKSVMQGEFNITRTSQTSQDNHIITTTRTYFYGGVDLTDVPMTQITYKELLAQRPVVEEQVSAALSTATGYWSASETWFGGFYVVGSSGDAAPPVPDLTPVVRSPITVQTTPTAPSVPIAMPSAPPSTPVGAPGSLCSAGVIPLIMLVWVGWRGKRTK